MNRNEGYLIGCDLSHWNIKTDISDFDFFFHKATEGRSFSDNKFIPRCDAFLNKKPFGLYHYARAENNGWELELDFYLKTIEPYIGKCVLALDFEGKSLHHHYSGEWLEKWLLFAKHKTGINPVLYISESEYNGLKDWIPEETKLWIANWSKEPKVKYDFWQYTKNPIDLDLYKGNKEDFLSLYNYKI